VAREEVVTMTQQTAWSDPWSEGVIARYLTVAGATVDLRGGGDHTYYRCTGCGDGSGSCFESNAREHAQGHAEKCRALPKPGGTT
jgi:hypothetical protein